MNRPEYSGAERPEAYFHELLNVLVDLKHRLRGIQASANKHAAEELLNAVQQLLAEDYTKLSGTEGRDDFQESARKFVTKALSHIQ